MNKETNKSGGTSTQQPSEEKKTFRQGSPHVHKPIPTPDSSTASKPSPPPPSPKGKP